MDKTIIIGGKAGAGIKEAGRMLLGVLANLGYHAFGYVDYPSLIRGGHNFVSLRFSEKPVYSVDKKADVIIATDGRSIQAHLQDAKEDTVWVINEKEKLEGAIQVPFKEVAPGFFKSSSVLGAVLKLFGIPLEEGLPFILSLPEREKNEQIYRDAYQATPTVFELKKAGERKGDVLTGNECIALGAVDGGLEFYIAYPMTPASPVLHYLAERKGEFGIKVIHPENEIGVINMAVGVAFAGKRAMVGTSGGGFALMTETLSLIGMSETPMVIYEAQRAGPSTGVPTYTGQSDLLFCMFAGHGDFPRVVLAPATPEEAYRLTRDALNIAWKFQVPVLILGDKHLGESYYLSKVRREKLVEEPKLWEGNGEYKRYAVTEDGISPLAFPGAEGIIVKGTSYEHDERGITVEDALSVKKMQDKRLRKGETLREYILSREDTVAVGGVKGSDRVLITWGSTEGTALDVAEEMGFKVVRSVFLEPFPEERLKQEIEGANLVISLECSASGQFEKLLKMHGITPHRSLKKYDGRPFFRDELIDILREV
ncbi:2-oxoglutarate ferredoxin oxidoreductase subunit alpha [Hydrogenivirga caldilitoris]|uniref:2-oxoglutarate ferredoxin oxidoreductase subunit alpha n=1 Tax=Hydrogenivirga caldilitoris TaxID=246264 RepID=A0A497XQN0_9AQUI|nr:2-oxoacid:acceptor oxidoreductase subunit alpha [Hydrogenivirga caldilitoris]RLJ70449.1 2-oxoglutarate ferredoxin oxidoreductase subunit alpha [Hydrogenivirga caldilitoris]